MGYLTGSNTPQALKAMALVGEHNRTVEYIRNNKNLTPKGKQKQIGANYLQHKQQITALEAEDKAARTSKADSLRRSLFGLSGSSDANATISYRDAQDRVAAIDSEEKALELLDRADLSNDEILTKAIVGKAAEAGWGNLVNTYTAKHPYYGSKLQERQPPQRRNQYRRRNEPRHELHPHRPGRNHQAQRRHDRKPRRRGIDPTPSSEGPR